MNKVYSISISFDCNGSCFLATVVIGWGISANIDVISDISIRITEIVDEHNMVDWQTNKDIHNKIAQDIDDMFYEIEKEKGIQVDFDSIDKIIENVITVALRRFK